MDRNVLETGEISPTGATSSGSYGQVPVFQAQAGVGLIPMFHGTIGAANAYQQQATMWQQMAQQQQDRSPSPSDRSSHSGPVAPVPASEVPSPVLSADKTMWLWPATPETTPQHSPRNSHPDMANMPPLQLSAAWAWPQQQMWQMNHALCQDEDGDDAASTNASLGQSSYGHQDSNAAFDGTESVYSMPTPSGSVAQARNSNSGPLWWTVAGADALVEQLSRGESAERRALMKWITEQAWQMAIRRHGCKVVQKALEVADRSEQLAIAEHLRGRVLEALKSPHANHVLQRCIVLLPPDRLVFVLAELQGRGAELARHRFGCRVIERLIEHCDPQATIMLVDEVLSAAADLARHEFGNYVVQHILEHGTAVQKERVCAALKPQAYKLAKHRVASHVVEHALKYCSNDDRQKLLDAMTSDSKDLASLGRSLYGSFVVRQLGRQSPSAAVVNGES